ncbi:hypothetical protein AKJ16_DCAP04982 [Drosera capensis]
MKSDLFYFSLRLKSTFLPLPRLKFILHHPRICSVRLKLQTNISISYQRNSFPRPVNTSTSSASSPRQPFNPPLQAPTSTPFNS